MHIRYRLALADTFSLISLSACRQRTQAFAFPWRGAGWDAHLLGLWL